MEEQPLVRHPLQNLYMLSKDMVAASGIIFLVHTDDTE